MEEVEEDLAQQVPDTPPATPPEIRRDRQRVLVIHAQRQVCYNIPAAEFPIRWHAPLVTLGVRDPEVLREMEKLCAERQWNIPLSHFECQDLLAPGQFAHTTIYVPLPHLSEFA